MRLILDVAFELPNGAPGQPEVDPLGLLGEAGEEELVADGVDQARDALAVIVNPPERRRGEIGRAVGPGNLEPVLDVLADFVAPERIQMVAHGDALAQLAQTRGR